MPAYDCGDEDCEECQRAFGPDRRRAIENYKRREAAYAALEVEPDSKEDRMATTEAEGKAFRLHAALSELLTRYKSLIRDTNSEPTFDEDDGVISAERALFENRPDAAWEVEAA